MELTELVSSNIKHLMSYKKISDNVLSKKIGKAVSTIRGYKNGKNVPPAEILILLSDEFEVSIDDLLRTDLVKEGVRKVENKNKDYDIKETLEDLVNRVAEIEERYGGDKGNG